MYLFSVYVSSQCIQLIYLLEMAKSTTLICIDCMYKKIQRPKIKNLYKKVSFKISSKILGNDEG